MDNLLAPPPDQVLQVTALTRLIKGQLEESFARVWVQGEVSNLRKQSSGHIYFSLKDAGSQIPCALFARDAARQSFELQDGMEILLLGDISVYEPHGRYQLIAKVAIQSGEGRLQIEYERLKRKLAAEGLFDSTQKQALPTLPKRIAVITSPTGAAVQDFLRILRRRDYSGEVIIFPAKVQGKGSAEDVEAMLQHAAASKGFDLVVLTRGGGSIEDLWTFNEERVARAVASCPLPVISAIGHEIDHVLTDFAADKRAETPSGAAELISSLYLEARQRRDKAQADLLSWAHTYIADYQSHLREYDARLQIIAPGRKVQHVGMLLDDMENQLKATLSNRLSRDQRILTAKAQKLLENHPKTRMGIADQHLGDFSRRLNRSVRETTANKSALLHQLKQRLDSGSLQATLKRGFAVVEGSDGRVLDRAEKAAHEAEVTARFHDGKITLKPLK